MDQSELRARPDVLVFRSAPLEEPLQVIGHLRAALWASSSCADTDFTVKLMDTYPDGRAMVMAEGVVRARYRHGCEATLLVPGSTYRLEVDLYSTALVFNRGHRIEVHVSSSNYPRYEVNPNTGGEHSEGGATEVARNTIHVGPQSPSRLLLPVVSLTSQ
jgi:putative CocE/NonD family hydrolase